MGTGTGSDGRVTIRDSGVPASIISVVISPLCDMKSARVSDALYRHIL